MPLAAGARLGPYEIVAPLGAGGMGEVYRARDTRLGREVALKILPPEVGGDPSRQQRFEQEARAVAALNHPNIVAIHDIGNDNGLAWIVSELVDGESLRNAAFNVRKTVDVAVQIADGLAAAHAAGITHRDLKPDNVMVTREGRVKILDFGLAKQTRDARTPDEATLTQTQAGTVLGTVGYMSPEQVRGQIADHRSDIFSFGVILYELLGGRRAFQRPTAVEIMNAILKEDPVELPDSVPGALRDMVNHCLEKEPANRFQSARDLGFALSSLAHASRSSASIAALPRKRIPRRPATIAAALALVAVGALADYLLRPAPQPPSWTGAILGGPAFAMDPRVSPDGQMLAFQTMVGTMTQVAVMKPESGNWVVLTRAQDKGLLSDLSWSRDGTRIYYDRVTDTPQGVYSVPVLGGEEQLVLEDAMYPQALPDGSLLVIRMNAERKGQIFRFWPENGKLQGLPVYIPSEVYTFPRVTPDGKEAILFGIAESVDSVPRLYAFDVNTGAPRRIAKDLPIETQIQAYGITRDGKSWLAIERAGNLGRLVALDRTKSSPLRPLLTLTIWPWTVEGGPDGTIYLEQMERPGELLQFSIAGGRPETVANLPLVPYATEQQMFALLPDGRAVLGSVLGGRLRLVLVTRGKEPTPLVNTTEETAPPLTPVGTREVAFLIGPEPRQTIAIASIATGRITRRIKFGKGPITSLASTPDGATLYCAAAGTIWTLPAAGGEPKKLRAGDSVSIDPAGRELLIKLNEKDRFRLIMLPRNGGPERDIPLSGDLRLTPFPLGPNAIDKEGRIALPVVSSDSWFWHSAWIDPKSGKLTRIPLDYVTDHHYAGWTPDGRVIALGLGARSSIWRFQPEATKK